VGEATKAEREAEAVSEHDLSDDRGLRAMMAVKFVDRGPASASFT
jgi:hypothetical protein